MFYFILIVIFVLWVSWYVPSPKYEKKQQEKEDIRLFRYYHSIHEKNENNVNELYKRYKELLNLDFIPDSEKMEFTVLRYLIGEYFKNSKFDNLTSTELKEHLVYLKHFEIFFECTGFNAKLLIEEFQTRILVEE